MRKGQLVLGYGSHRHSELPGVFSDVHHAEAQFIQVRGMLFHRIGQRSPCRHLVPEVLNHALESLRDAVSPTSTACPVVDPERSRRELAEQVERKPQGDLSCLSYIAWAEWGLAQRA